MTGESSMAIVLAANDSKELYHFHWIDYAVFVVMLVASAASGIYYGYCRKPPIAAAPSAAPPLLPSEAKSQQHHLQIGDHPASAKLSEYLLGSRSLRPFPVAMSLIASYISGVTILGTPTEIYNYGTQYWLIVVPIILMGWTVAKVYLPVYSALQVTSSYEYLELRFSPTVRTIASAMFVLDEILFLPIIIYVPALAFNQVTGINIHLIGGIVCVVCIFYTILGGIKAVVFTDAWQVGVMFVAVLVIVIIGTVALGGPEVIFAEAERGGRIEFFNFNPSPYERHTFWSVLIGGFLYWLSFNAVNQTMVQRYMSLPDERQARLSIGLYTIGIALFVSVCCYAGCLVYARFAHCDPLYAGTISNGDQLFPHFVMDTIGHLHGLPGLFVAGVFGAALSSLSVVLNSTSAVILEDLLKGAAGLQFTELIETLILKITIAILGAAAILLVLVVEQMGGILVVATSLSAIASGTSFGVFTLGMLVPRANTKGAIWGMVAGALLSGWVSLGTQVAASTGLVTAHKLGVWTDECAKPGGNETFYPHYPDESNVFPLYRLSFHWINPIGVTAVLVVGALVSWATGGERVADLDARLISPVMWRWLPPACFEHANRRRQKEEEVAAAALLSKA